MTKLGHQEEEPNVWEYDVIQLEWDSRDLVNGVRRQRQPTEVLNTYSRQGWELISAFDTYGRGGGPVYVLRRAVKAPR